MQSVPTNSPLKFGPASSKEAAESRRPPGRFHGRRASARTDIVDLIRAARAAGLYVNLITSGLPMTKQN